ncbi:MAG: oligosaccharide flippase family protein [Deltaproteobacteria bacterium]|nr:oligosaccharide flippase family protein [Deltaproteobacteria bacterium]
MSLLRKSILSAGGTVICAALGIITQMILSRKLGPDGMGQYQLLLSTSTLAVAVATLGIGQANVYFLNHFNSPKAAVVMNSVYWWAVAGTVLFVGYVGAVKEFVNYFGRVPIEALLIFGVGLLGVLLVNLLRPVLVAELLMREAVLVTVAAPSAYLVTVACLAATTRLSVVQAIIAMAVGNAAGALVCIWFVRDGLKWHERFDARFFWKLLPHGMQLASSNIVQLASATMGILLLRHFMHESFSEVGYYGRAIAVCGLMQLLSASATPLLYSKWSSVNQAERTAQVERATRIQTAMGIGIVFFLLVFGRYLIILLYGHSFLAAVQPLYLLSFAHLIKGPTNIFTNLFAGAGQPSLNSLIWGISLPFLVLFSFLLVPRFGIAGAAIAEICSSSASLLAAACVAGHRYGVDLSQSFVFKGSDLRYICRNILSSKTTVRHANGGAE